MKTTSLSSSNLPLNSRLEYHHESNNDKLIIYAPNDKYEPNTRFILNYLQHSFENKPDPSSIPELTWKTIRTRGNIPVWSIKIQNTTQLPIFAGYYSVVFNSSVVAGPSELSYFYAWR